MAERKHELKMTKRQADIFLYQEKIKTERENEQPYVVRFGVQLVLDDVLETESHFVWSGDLHLDREKARDYGKIVGKQLHKKGVSKYLLHLNQRYNDQDCMPERHSDVWALEGVFEEAIKRKI